MVSLTAIRAAEVVVGLCRIKMIDTNSLIVMSSWKYAHDAARVSV